MELLITDKLKSGMKVGQDVYNSSNRLLVPKGNVLNDSAIALLKSNYVIGVWIEDDNLTAESNPGTDMLRSDYLQEEENTKRVSAAYEHVIREIPMVISSEISKEYYAEKYAMVSAFRSSYSQKLSGIRVRLNDLISKNMELDPDALIDEMLGMLDYKGGTINILDVLCEMHEYDDDTFSHSISVALLAHLLGTWMGMGEADLRMLVACGLFHDIGKVKIPKEILLKPGSLSPEERRIIEMHPRYGYEFLSEYNIADEIKEATLMHHECCDGSGYPGKLSRDSYNIFTKVVTICDVYNAMTSDRSYRKALSPFFVLERFELEGLKKYDPRALLVFMENVANTYLNCPVRLNDGKVGFVVYINKSKLGRPIVKCGDSFIDLSTDPSLYIEEMLSIYQPAQ